MNINDYFIEKATRSQSQAICDLVNLTYRGEVGWTRETHIIEGNRTSRQEVELALSNPNACFLVINQPAMLVSCIYVAREETHAYIGFFSVHPDLQGRGLGKHVLKQAELFAAEQMKANRLIMFVVSQRPELIAFYERLGYSRTGQIEDYPVQMGIGMPKATGLTIEYLEKII